MQKHDRSNGQNRLSEWLIAANLPDGLKLPTALALATSLKLSPADVRAGLREAETEGLIVRSKPGWYYSKRLPIRTMLTQPSFSTIDIAAIAARTKFAEAMQARLILEPEIARLAALRSSGDQVAELRKMCQGIRAANTWDEYDDLDWHFHNALAEASNNTLLLELQQVLNGVRRVVVKNVFRAHSPGPPADFSAFDEHDAIVWAIDQRDGPYAHETMRRHLATTAELYEQ